MFGKVLRPGLCPLHGGRKVDPSHPLARLLLRQTAVLVAGQLSLYCPEVHLVLDHELSQFGSYGPWNYKESYFT